MAIASYNFLPVGHPDNPKPYPVCGGQIHLQPGKYCMQPAGKGTVHPGEGRCKLHGGASLMGPDSGTWKGGRYAHAWRGRMAAAFKAMQQDVSDPLDLLPELEVQRVLLSLAIQDLAGAAPETPAAE